jgi:protein-disulfide isomerase
MNTKRILFWGGFIIVLILIIWGLIVSMGKDNFGQNRAGTPRPISASDHIFGPSDAPITIIEYSDFQCPACQIYHYVVEKLLSSSTVPIRFVYRHFPLAQHKNAIPASLASESASLQGKFFEMHRLLFENQSDWSELSDPNPIFIGYAQQIGLNLERFKTELASSTLKKLITDSVDEGIKIGISGTPTFFINGKVIDNPQGYEAFKTLIETTAQQSTK